MSDDTKEKFQSFIQPITMAALSGLMGFFIYQQQTSNNSINAKLDAYAPKLSSVETKLIHLEREVVDLKDYRENNENWIKSWLQTYQGAVDYAKKNKEIISTKNLVSSYK